MEAYKYDIKPSEPTSADEATTAARKHIKTSLDNCHGKLDQYYQLINETPVYAAATVLNPAQKWRFFDLQWKSQRQKRWLTTVKRYVKRFWEEAYHDKAEEQPFIAEQTLQQTLFEANRSHQPSNLQQFLHPPDFYTQHQTTAARDKYQKYIKASPLPYDNPLQWWGTRRKEFPILSQMVLDLLSIPLMFVECERVFSST